VGSPGLAGQVLVRTEIDDAERREALENDPPGYIHGLHGLGTHAFGPAAEEAREPGDALVVLEPSGERSPRHPAALAELAQGFEHHLADDAGGARIAGIRGETQDLRLGARL